MREQNRQGHAVPLHEGAAKRRKSLQGSVCHLGRRAAGGGHFHEKLPPQPARSRGRSLPREAATAAGAQPGEVAVVRERPLLIHDSRPARAHYRTAVNRPCYIR